jgi:hypothetical protein
MNPRPLGYEQCDDRLYRPEVSHVVRLSWLDGHSEAALGRERRHCPAVFRCVSFTNSFTWSAAVR